MQRKMIDRIDGLLDFSTFQKQVLCFRMISLYILKYKKNQKNIEGSLKNNKVSISMLKPLQYNGI